MSIYFTKFPVISYNGTAVRDITRRTNFIQNLSSNPYIFLPYTIKEGEKPEDIAYNYYNTVDATWLVLLANNIVDPYNQWPMSSEILNEYIISKYSQQSGLTGADVIYWAMDETRLDNIVYYYNTTGNMELKVAPETFPYVYDESNSIIGRELVDGWLPYRVYDYENALNENKREILVVENNYYNQIKKEFERMIKV